MGAARDAAWKIDPGGLPLREAVREIGGYRDLLFFLVWREIKVRYKQTVLGALWAAIQPVGTALLFTLVFGLWIRVDTGELRYLHFSLAGVLLWQYFVAALGGSSHSLVEFQAVLTKVYFPRVLLPVSRVISPLLDLAVSLGVVLAVLLATGAELSWRILALPLFVAFAGLTALAFGLWFSALYARYRDFRFLIPFLVQLWMFLSPVIYPTSALPAPLRALYALNPMAGAVEGCRWALVGGGELEGMILGVSLASVLGVLVCGLWIFRRLERTMADVI